MKTAHTPTPWSVKECDKTAIIDVNGNVILDTAFSDFHLEDDDKPNAAHIVKCVNLHDELVAALKKCGMLLEHGGFDLEFIDSALKKAGAI